MKEKSQKEPVPKLNVRVPPELFRKFEIKLVLNGKTKTGWVVEQIDKYVKEK